MEIDFVIANSIELDTILAVTELIQSCECQLGGKEPSAGIFYSGIDYDNQLALCKICEKWPDLQIIGCTSDAEFSSTSAYEEDSMVLTLFVSKQIKFASGFINNKAIDIAEECNKKFTECVDRLGQDPKLCILISDVIKINGETVMQQLTKVTDNKLPIFGGASSDSWRFIESKQFYNGAASTSISPFLLLSGDFNFSYGIDNGWEAIGDTGIITKSEGNVIYEIDNKPALEFYSNILGKNTKPTLELPLAIYDKSGEFRFMRTTYENYNENIGSVTYLGDVPVDYKVRITMVNRESILEGARKSIDYAYKTFPTGNVPKVVLCFSCSARRVMLGTRAIEESKLVSEKMPEGMKFVGFYCYGEFCPNLTELRNQFHNETFVTLLLG